MTTLELIPSHTKTADFEYDVFEIDGYRFVFDPQSISAFALDEDAYERLTAARDADAARDLLRPLYDQGFFRPRARLGTAQWGRGQAGITLMNTNLCNLRCPYCVMDHDRRRSHEPMMTWERAK